MESYAFQHGSFTAIKYLPLMIRGYQFGTKHNYCMLYCFVFLNPCFKSLWIKRHRSARGPLKAVTNSCQSLKGIANLDNSTCIMYDKHKGISFFFIRLKSKLEIDSLNPLSDLKTKDLARLGKILLQQKPDN